jgi:hypothetical protein
LASLDQTCSNFWRTQAISCAGLIFKWLWGQSWRAPCFATPDDYIYT